VPNSVATDRDLMKQATYVLQKELDTRLKELELGPRSVFIQVCILILMQNI
jgi:hypothetical protein